MISEELMNQYKEGISLRELSINFNIDRKKLSIELRKLGIKTNNKSYAKELTDLDMEDIINMYNNKFSLRKIGRIKNISHSYVKELLTKANIINNKEVDILKDIVYDYYFNNYSTLPNIAETLNIPESRIRNIFIDNGWEFRHCGRVHTFDQNKFELIDSHEKAYWFGFLYADCYNNEEKGQIEFTLAKIDKNQIVKFLDFMDANDIEIKDRVINLNGKVHEACRSLLCSKKLSTDLSILGCVQAKSLIVEFPNEKALHKIYQQSFLAGYFDGNGHIGVYEKSTQIGFFSGSEKMLYSIKDLLEKDNDILHNSKINKRDNETSSFQYRCSGVENAIRLYNYCYKHLPIDICLDRKQAEFKKIIHK